MRTKPGRDRIVFVSPGAVEFSGQTEACRAAVAALRADGRDCAAIEFPALDRTAGLGHRAGYLLRLFGVWSRIAALLFERPLRLVFSPAQTRAALARMVLPVLLVLRLRRDVRPIIVLHGHLFTGWAPGSVEWRLFRALLRRCRRVTVLGARQKEALVALGVPENAVVVLPNTTDMPVLSERACRDKHRSGDGVSLLHLALLIESKGFPEYVEALRILARRGATCPIRAVLCGPIAFSGFCRRFRTAEAKETWITEMAAEINRSPDVRMSWIAGAAGAEKTRLYRDAQVFVFPSSFPVEAQPLVLLEAMAAGCAVIASRAGEIPSTLPDGAGILLESVTPQAIADAIERLCSDRDLRERLALAARACYEARHGAEAHRRRWSEMAACLESPAPEGAPHAGQ